MSGWLMGCVDITASQWEQAVSEPRSLSVLRCKGVEVSANVLVGYAISSGIFTGGSRDRVVFFAL